MNETTKATARRLQHITSPAKQWFNWHAVLRGKVIDVGPGGDPLDPVAWPQITELVLFDKDKGDANNLDEHFPPATFDCVHGSQVLEHLFDPYDAVRRMLIITKPGGTIVMTVPCWDHYEHRIWPSQFNSDHKTTWSLWHADRDGNFVGHILVQSFLKYFAEVATPVLVALCNLHYDYQDTHSDQTMRQDLPVEAFIEFVLRKK